MAVDSRTLDSILQKTISSIEQSKEEMYAIAESARNERQRVQDELEKVRNQTRKVVDEVDGCEKEDRAARRRLAHVSADFHHSTEEDLRQAYEEASQVQVRLALLREKEKQLKARRQELELIYRHLTETQARAERLITHVGVALDYLSQDLRNIALSAEELSDNPPFALAIIRACEEERHRVARGLHDGPAQSLAHLVMLAELCEKLLQAGPDTVRAELGNLKQEARLTLQDIRKTVFDLSPVDLGAGITGAIESYINDFAGRTGISVSLETRGNRLSYTPAVEIAVFRIVQETLNNAYKHGRPSRIRVNLETHSDRLLAVVEDDGPGFDLRRAEEKGTFGLTNMRDWARLVQGNLEIISAPGAGTTVRLEVPWNNQE